MSATAGGADNGPVSRFGFQPGMVVQELGWDEDIDEGLRAQIEEAVGGQLVDDRYGDVVDAVILWWRNDDGDLVDGLVDSLTDLADGGMIWLLTPKVGTRQLRRRQRHLRGGPDGRPGDDDEHRGRARTGRRPSWCRRSRRATGRR